MNGTQLRFIIHRHETEHPHYDLRLQTEGGCMSWILPHEPPTREDEKRLAIQDRENKSVTRISEGIVEDGYGIGKAEVWDEGTCRIKEKKRHKVIFEAEGKKFFGKFILLLPSWGRWGKKPLWVLTKY